MKWILYIFCLLTLNKIQSQTYEIDPFNHKDTINKIDSEGKKQGKWIVTGKSRPGSCYNIKSKVEEGIYHENKKIGIWKEYYCNGNTKCKTSFVNGRPDGPASKYFENGKLKEEGIWKINKWVGNYKLFYENGQARQEFNFNESGKRDGEQKYFFENGKIMIEGNWAGGQEAGTIKEYYESGEIKSEKTFNTGIIDVATITDFEAKKPLPKIEEKEPKKQLIVKKEELIQERVVRNTPVNLNGYHVLFNKNRQLSKEGEFEDNVLMYGKNYIYDENGILQKIEIYRNGKYVGNEQIDD